MGKPSCHPDSAQRQLARACTVAPVLGSHTHTSHTHETQATIVGYPRTGSRERGSTSAQAALTSTG